MQLIKRAYKQQNFVLHGEYRVREIIIITIFFENEVKQQQQ